MGKIDFHYERCEHLLMVSNLYIVLSEVAISRIICLFILTELC
jgi:hypothetical protein